MALPKPPATYERFSERFPRIRAAWDMIGEAGKDGPLDENTCRLIKLAIAIGAMREGAVHSGVRKALAMGITIRPQLRTVNFELSPLIFARDALT